MTDLPKDLHVVLIRRGEAMRAVFPMDPAGMWDTTGFEMATGAVKVFLELQASMPGRADAPIIPGLTELGLFLPHALGPLDPEMMIGPQLMGHWTELSILVTEGTGAMRPDTPAVALNLLDMRTN